MQGCKDQKKFKKRNYFFNLTLTYQSFRTLKNDLFQYKCICNKLKSCIFLHHLKTNKKDIWPNIFKQFHSKLKRQMATLLVYAHSKDTTTLNLSKHHSLFIALADAVVVAVAEMRWKAINCEALTLFFLFQ